MILLVKKNHRPKTDLNETIGFEMLSSHSPLSPPPATPGNFKNTAQIISRLEVKVHSKHHCECILTVNQTFIAVVNIINLCPVRNRENLDIYALGEHVLVPIYFLFFKRLEHKNLSGFLLHLQATSEYKMGLIITMKCLRCQLTSTTSKFTIKIYSGIKPGKAGYITTVVIGISTKNTIPFFK